MKTFIMFACLCLISFAELSAQAEFDLDPSQSMLMTGKGPGQDGTINPYRGQDCFAIVDNIGKGTFTVRIQSKGEIIQIIPIREGASKRIKLLKNQELYLDTESIGKVKARVGYEEIKK